MVIAGCPVSRHNRVSQHDNRKAEAEVPYCSTSLLIRCAASALIATFVDSTSKPKSPEGCCSEGSSIQGESSLTCVRQYSLPASAYAASSSSFCHSAKSAYCI